MVRSKKLATIINERVSRIEENARRQEEAGKKAMKQIQENHERQRVDSERLGDAIGECRREMRKTESGRRSMSVDPGARGSRGMLGGESQWSVVADREERRVENIIEDIRSQESRRREDMKREIEHDLESLGRRVKGLEQNQNRGAINGGDDKWMDCIGELRRVTETLKDDMMQYNRRTNEEISELKRRNGDLTIELSRVHQERDEDRGQLGAVMNQVKEIMKWREEHVEYVQRTSERVSELWEGNIRAAPAAASAGMTPAGSAFGDGASNAERQRDEAAYKAGGFRAMSRMFGSEDGGLDPAEMRGRSAGRNREPPKIQCGVCKRTCKVDEPIYQCRECTCSACTGCYDELTGKCFECIHLRSGMEPKIPRGSQTGTGVNSPSRDKCENIKVPSDISVSNLQIWIVSVANAAKTAYNNDPEYAFRSVVGVQQLGEDEIDVPLKYPALENKLAQGIRNMEKGATLNSKLSSLNMRCAKEFRSATSRRMMRILIDHHSTQQGSGVTAVQALSGLNITNTLGVPDEQALEEFLARWDSIYHAHDGASLKESDLGQILCNKLTSLQSGLVNQEWRDYNTYQKEAKAIDERFQIGPTAGHLRISTQLPTLLRWRFGYNELGGLPLRIQQLDAVKQVLGPTSSATN